MKKKIITLLAVLTLIAMLTVGVYASSNKLSYGLDVIAYNLEFAKTGLVGDYISFEREDFEKALGVSKISSITVLTLPDKECGVLELSGVPVMKNQIISAKNIENLRFVPGHREELETSFVIGSVSSSQPLAITCKISLIDSLNFAPEVNNPSDGYRTLEAIEGISCYSYLKAQDPENDKLIYKVVSYPENGTVRILDREGGYYCYKSFNGFVGSDSFTYVACDKYGNTSEEVTVSVNVAENTSGITYRDMADHPAYYSALKLAEKGIFIGETVCSTAYFNPDETVRRDEFLAMAMSAAGVIPDYNEKAVTAFSDDSLIPIYLKSYVSYAEKAGYISELDINNEGKFCPAESMTTAQAAVVLFNILGIESSGDAQVFADSDSFPEWAEAALATMADVGVIQTNSYNGYDSEITRADAAFMLCKIMEICEK